MKRKQFIQQSLVGLGSLLALPSSLNASSHRNLNQKQRFPKPTQQVLGVQHTKIGEAIVSTILDGYIDIQPEWWVNISREELEQELPTLFLPKAPVRLSINTYIINTGDRLIAIDSGADQFFGPPAGHYAENLKAAGINPEDIDTVLLTHLHPDHIGGMIAGGQALFPKAEIIVNALEHNYWMSASNRAQAPEMAHPWFDAVKTMTEKYEDRLKLFTKEEDVIPGFQAIALHGHTPGHTGYIFSNQGESLFFWADITDQTGLQLNHPERTLIFDVDKAQGQKARIKGIELAASERLQIAGSHIPFPSFGHIDKTREGYQYIPSEWTYEL